MKMSDEYQYRIEALWEAVDDVEDDDREHLYDEIERLTKMRDKEVKAEREAEAVIKAERKERWLASKSSNKEFITDIAKATVVPAVTGLIGLLGVAIQCSSNRKIEQDRERSRRELVDIISRREEDDLLNKRALDVEKAINERK